jgi:hypothetical protein
LSSILICSFIPIPKVIHIAFLKYDICHVMSIFEILAKNQSV